jgi:7-alpha-hydroxysteroid dehydrogenase
VILDRFRLTDRAAVVTGAGRGIGAATAVALAEAGADVLVAARTEEQLAAVAERIEAAGRRAVVVPADLSDLDAAAGLADAATDAFGRLDVVVNNVGGWMPRELTRTEARHLEAAFRFNVSTAHAVTRAAVPLMLASPRPDGETAAVVNVSSAVGSAAGRGYVAYGTAKAALSHWTRLAARDLAPRVRVNAVAVGAVATSALALVTEDEAVRRGLEEATPLRRIGDPAEVAAAILFLASPASSYLTGQVVGVDGGLDRPSLDPGDPDL